MASTTDLGKWMITNGGVYNPEAVYEQLTMVMYDNSTYITLKTVQGVTPTDDHVNYQLMAKGFDPTALGSVQAKDTSAVLGEVGGTVSAQDLVDWVVDQAATKLLKISDLVSVQTNDATKGVSAALAYAMGQKLDQLNSNLNDKIPTLDDVCAKKIGAESNNATFRLKKAENGSSSVSSRYTAFLVLCGQSADLIGVYAIGVNANQDMITKIAGTDAIISRKGDNVTVTFSGKSYIYSKGLLFAPRDVI